MSKTTVESVAEFQTAFKMNDPATPSFPQHDILVAATLRNSAATMQNISQSLLAAANTHNNKLLMRAHLIQEELAELTKAMAERNMVECLDGLVDLTYVVDGTFCTLGLAHLKQPAFDEVHRSNMSKLGEDGEPILSPGGRVQKGPNYFKANLQQFLEGVDAT